MRRGARAAAASALPNACPPTQRVLFATATSSASEPWCATPARCRIRHSVSTMRQLFRIACLIALITVAGRPAAAQIDLSGEWAGTFYEDLPHRGGMQLGDYTGLPLNEAGWRKAESWDEAVVATHERQCIPHVVNYALRGPATIRFSKITDPDSGRLIAWQLLGS